MKAAAAALGAVAAAMAMALAGACAPLEIDNRVGFVGTDAAPDGFDSAAAGMPPSLATFQAAIQPFFDGGGCSNMGCHAVGASAPGGYGLVPMPDATASLTNYELSICARRFTSYDPPAGPLFDNFCSDAATPTSGHYGSVANAADCGALAAWAAEGAGATPPQCQ